METLKLRSGAPAKVSNRVPDTPWCTITRGLTPLEFVETLDWPQDAAEADPDAGASAAGPAPAPKKAKKANASATARKASKKASARARKTAA